MSCWSRVSNEEFEYGGMQRRLEAYVAWRSSPRSQWRLTALNLLQPDALSASRYTDAAGTPIFHTLGYVMHDGGHGTIPSDWDLFLQFMKKHF